jgi:hypothetical protein
MLALSGACIVAAQEPMQPQAAAGTIRGEIADTDAAAISGAKVTLEETQTKVSRTVLSDGTGAFVFEGVPASRYDIRIKATGFSSWKVEGIDLAPGQELRLDTIELGVESIDSTVNAITMEDLAEQQITAEEHQRILGVLPNFYVSYVGSGAAPLTRKQKFKLAFRVSTDALTFGTTAINAGIEQWQGDFSGYGSGFAGYASRYGATYGDRLSSTMLGAAVLPSLLHQDPRYFYNGHGSIVHRALYAISTVVICKGDNGKWQPNYSNVFGNLGAAGISTLYYPRSDRHSVQVTVDNTLIGISEGAFGTLFQEFLLRHLTRGGAAKQTPVP